MAAPSLLSSGPKPEQNTSFFGVKLSQHQIWWSGLTSIYREMSQQSENWIKESHESVKESINQSINFLFPCFVFPFQARRRHPAAAQVRPRCRRLMASARGAVACSALCCAVSATPTVATTTTTTTRRKTVSCRTRRAMARPE